jgi:hypothetical protein
MRFSFRSIQAPTSMTIAVGAVLLALAGEAVPLQAQTSNPDYSDPAVHNIWSLGAHMPTPRQGASTGAIGKKIYVVGGANDTTVLSVNEIYDTTTNRWTKGAPMPTARWTAASAVVNNALYVIGGGVNGSETNVVEAYQPRTNKWSTRRPMPILDDSIYAVAEKGIIYVIGGCCDSNGRFSAVWAYNPAKNRWKKKAPLNVAKSQSASGLIGSTIIAAGGLTNGNATNDNEGYNAKTNKWRTLAPMPTGRQAGCFEASKGVLYVAGGHTVGNGDPLSILEAYSLKTNSWTTGLASMPDSVVNPGSANVAGRLYCFGGSDAGDPFQGNIFNYVQIYKP